MRSRIICGDVQAVLRKQAADSFDSCLTDPPYGLTGSHGLRSPQYGEGGKKRYGETVGGFMGMKWDGSVPRAEVWADVLRVLKPGAPMLVFGGTRTFHRLACAIEDAGFLLVDTLCWLHGQGFPKSHSQLKPAWEPITLAFKPGKRVLNIDTSRIGGTPWKAHDATGLAETKFFTDGKRKLIHKEPHDSGRWPANLILDEAAASALDQQSGILTSGARTGNRTQPKTKNTFGSFAIATESPSTSSEGGASRFFYVAKASKSDRGPGNTHPTVKPTKLDTELARYLLTLMLPPAQGVKRRLLVPFSGSGSEMLGAKAAGWDYVLGIDNCAEYVAIAERRLKAAA